MCAARASALQRRRRQLRLADRLLRHRRRALLDPRRARARRAGRRARRARRVTISSASHVERNVASTAAIVANRKPSMKSPKSAAPTQHADADPERRDLLLQLERRELDLELRDRRRVLGDLLGRAAEPAVRLALDWGGHGLSSRSPSRARSPRRAPRRSRGTGSGRRPSASPSAAAGARCGPDGACRVPPAGSSVGASPLRARLDQARLQLAQERGIVGERRADLRLDAAGGLRLLDERLELVGRATRPSDRPSSFLGGRLLRPSPRARSSTRARRAAIVEAAPRPA